MFAPLLFKTRFITVPMIVGVEPLVDLCAAMYHKKLDAAGLAPVKVGLIVLYPRVNERRWYLGHHWPVADHHFRGRGTGLVGASNPESIANGGAAGAYLAEYRVIGEVTQSVLVDATTLAILPRRADGVLDRLAVAEDFDGGEACSVLPRPMSSGWQLDTEIPCRNDQAASKFGEVGPWVSWS